MPQAPKSEAGEGLLRIGAVLLAITFMASQSCRQRMAPEENKSACFAGGIASVPIIATVRIAPDSSHQVGHPEPGASPFPGGLVQLVRVDVDIENVLKGDVPLGPNSVYYFIPAKVSGPPLLSLFGARTFRLLLCLRNDSGKLRVASDFNPHCEFRVFSGSHPAFRRESAQPVAKSIVDLLLTPGEGTGPSQMMDAILDSRLRMLPAEYVAPKLLEIAASGAPDISAAACLMLREVITDNIAPKQQALALNIRLGISPQDADKWRAESLLRAGLVSDWWKPSDIPASTLTMKAPRDAEATLRFCRSDAALGIRPLRP